jgi:RNA polymerase sigma-70 factor (ECF subfamily)
VVQSHDSGPDAGDPLFGLVRSVLDGDAIAERELLERVGPTIVRAARGVLGPDRAELQDAVQQAMLAFLDALPGFEQRSSVVHFAARVAALTAMNLRRRADLRRRVTPLHPDDALDLNEAVEPSPMDALAAARRRAALRELLIELPQAQAEVLTMHVVAGHTVAETAQALRVPLDTVRSRLRAALSALRKRIAADTSLRGVLTEVSHVR